MRLAYAAETTSCHGRDCVGEMTWPWLKLTAPAPQLSSPATYAANFSRTLRAANCAARPFKSVPALAAVALALGILLVSLAVARMSAYGMPNSCATICATLVCKPCPISVPPWLICTLPSVYTCTNAPAWLNSVAVKLMPNLTGVSAMPRLKCFWLEFQAKMASRRRIYWAECSSFDSNSGRMLSSTGMP